MIITLTPNPSLDRTIYLPNLELGEVNRAVSVRVDPGGKGVNIARALRNNGYPTRAIVPLGGRTGEFMRRLLRETGVDFVESPFQDETRTNTAIIDQQGRTTKVNEPGPVPSQGELEALIEVTLTQSANAKWLALCGTLPMSTPASFFAQIISNTSAPVAVDTSGMALAVAVKAKPDLIKPNNEELAELIGRELKTLNDVINAAHSIVQQGVSIVVASLGSLGAVMVTEADWYFASATVAKPQSTVGAGDSLLAGTLQALSQGASYAEALKQGVAWGAAAVSLPGSKVPTPEDIAAIAVATEVPELETPLD